MDSKDKIAIADLILEYLENKSKHSPINTSESIGVLNKPQGIIGFKPAPAGSPVFEESDRYYIYVETLDGAKNHKISYYKKTLRSEINFYSL